jgi:hypothetical protein
MRALDDTPIDPQIAAELDAIDATLAGEPVDPQYAEIAELALLLTADRPEPSREFLQSLDERVERRFAPPAGSAGRAGAGPATVWRRLTAWGLGPVWGTAAVGMAAAVAVVIVLASGGSGGSRPNSLLRDATLAPGVTHGPVAPQSYSAGSSATSTTASSGSGASTTASSGSSAQPTPATTTPAPSAQAPAAAKRAAPHAGAPVNGAAFGPLTTGSGSAAGSAGSPSSSSAPAAAGVPQAASIPPTPQTNGRKIVQSAQLALTAPANRIEAVSQELFNVVGNQSGVVQRSSVTGGGSPGAYAQFLLSIPSANLSRTLAQLSRLQYAHVASRTDATQDVNNQFVGARRAIGNFEALRTSLLKQLAAAVTTQQVDSIQARLNDVSAKINALESQLRNLNHRVNFSQVQVTINAGSVPVSRHHPSNHGFTLGGAVHDAGRVLTVAAGVGLIALAAFVPVGLLAALGLWIALGLKRRRREQALDLA